MDTRTIDFPDLLDFIIRETSMAMALTTYLLATVPGILSVVVAIT
jgi:hypothetical protein